MKFIPYLAVLFSFAAAMGKGESVPNSLAAASADKVVWIAQTNDWPEKLWIYKVVPQEFSEAVVSNVMAIGSFSMSDRVKTPDYLKDKLAMRFGASSLKYLEIAPSWGFINYHDEAPLGMREGPSKGVPLPISGVPNEAEATKLGLNYLRMVGVDISQIATKKGTCDLDLHWNKGTRGYFLDGKEITETNCYGVFFSRSIDGIAVEPLADRGGVSVSFGDHAKVIDLQVCWRKLQPYQLCQSPSPSEIEEWITSGKVLTQRMGTRTPYKIESDQRTKIQKVQFFYSGQPGDSQMNFSFPYATIEAVAEGKSGTNGFWFRCPMTMSKDNWSVIR